MSSSRIAVAPVLRQRRLKPARQASAGRYRLLTMYQPVAAPAAGRLETVTELHEEPALVDHCTASVALAVADSFR